ncbi:MAG: hypothetical protein ACREBE_14410, partial [bacterium]
AARSVSMATAAHGESNASPKALAVAAMLLLRPSSEWQSFVQRLAASPKVFTSVVLIAAPLEHRRHKLLSALREADLGDLFLRLVELFPYSTDPQLVGFVARSVEADDAARDWRNETLRQLEARGTDEALGALRRLRDRLPLLSWLGATDVTPVAVPGTMLVR